MADERRSNGKRVQPSKRCPGCGGWAAPETLAANNGRCLVCYPPAGYTLELHEDKAVKRG